MWGGPKIAFSLTSQEKNRESKFNDTNSHTYLWDGPPSTFEPLDEYDFHSSAASLPYFVIKLDPTSQNDPCRLHKNPAFILYNNHHHQDT